MKQFFKVMPSPVGRLKLVANDHSLLAILWENDDPKRVRLQNPDHDPLHACLCATERQLAEYFSGARSRFTIPLELSGTPFQKAVWDRLLRIPFGETRTYGSIAKDLGNEQGSRAVGAATGRNPISIITPCHRVIGASGSLTGFAGGLEAKRYLLALEQGAVPKTETMALVGRGRSEKPITQLDNDGRLR
jgi:methylated-DNA-[protein]-cysteine S-methyltransferase